MTKRIRSIPSIRVRKKEIEIRLILEIRVQKNNH